MDFHAAGFLFAHILRGARTCFGFGVPLHAPRHKINIPRHSRGFYIYGLIRPLLTSCA